MNGIFIDPDGLARLEEIYSRRTGSHLPFAETCYQCNKLVIEDAVPRRHDRAGAIIWARWRRRTGRRATCACRS